MRLPRILEVPLIYVLYWTLGCLFLGILFAPAVRTYDADPSVDSTHGHAHLHSQVEVDPDNAPEVSIKVENDALAGWNVYVAVENFRFAPERVNQANTPNEGHAHLYLNGNKVTRLYGTAFHLTGLQPGENVVSVSLNANDHSDLVLGGEPIEAAALVVVGDG